MKKAILVTLLTALLVVLGACTNNEDQAETSKKETVGTNQEEQETDTENTPSGSMAKFANAPGEINENASENLLTMNTKNVTRISTSNPIETSILVSQTIWPATHKENQPGTVILAPLGNWQNALASTDLIHHPNNGPLLFIQNDRIPENILHEINRLNPIGNTNGTQVMVMGEVSEAVLSQLSDYKVERITGENPADFAKNIDDAYADVSGGYPEGVIIASAEESNQLYTIPAVNWIAHMPEPILYVTETEIPEETIEALEKRKNKANIYILGPESVISKDLGKQLKEYGKVQRIGSDAKNPVAASIEFAKYKDQETGFGWGLTGSGHGVSFVSTESPEAAIAAAPFSHLGKHAPLIWLDKGELQQETYDFLADIKPMFKDTPTEGPYNHAFLIGDHAAIPFQTQGIIDDKLEIVQETGEGHSGH
ncbi:cell wall-binding repeat-containing protein [Niallia endozanthoxylica]|uniref:Cell wall-binding repeat-containing protein n=1 Tax=Niallia endozanthoxylica TaxID=2036016 RepID=A0A5J5GW46_9BACI|nr:cell wall-binding repeat-containing protein [Niallia endozanthoxylica]KAA9012556.1 cell wall-binding repeat-containing protein [Niallia endozanthoxylica]